MLPIFQNLAQAGKYRLKALIYREFFPQSQQYGIAFRGFNVRTGWFNPFFKLKNRPTIFNENLQEKSASCGFPEGLSE